MKHLIYAFSLLMVTGAFAQDKPVDKVEETKVKTMKVKKDGKIIEKKVKVTTKKEQEVITDSTYEGTIDAPRVFPKVKVTKTVSIDSDNDPFYDTTDTIVYYKKDDSRFSFKSSDNGFMMSDENDEMYGSAKRSSQSQYYILNFNNNSGLGYFNADGNFVVEYYNPKTNELIIEAFEVDSKF